MSEQLRSELARIAEGAPVAGVPADTWDRARRSVRRDTAAVVAAVAVVVALVAGALAWLPDRDGVAPADGDRGALPAYLPVPGEGEPMNPTDGLAVGAQAVAMAPRSVVGQRRVVVVDARTGAYQRLLLPDFGAATGRDLTGTVHPLALSPAGTTLAYPRVRGRRSVDTLRTGLGLVDLGTGQVREIPLEDAGRPVLVRSVWFSPDGRTVLWTGQPVLGDDGGGRSYGDETAGGLIAPGSSRSAPLPGRRQDETLAVAVDDDATVARVGSRSTRLLRAGADTLTVPATRGVVLSGGLDARSVSSLVNTWTPGDDRAYSLRWVTASRTEPDTPLRQLATPAPLAGTDWRVLEWIDAAHAVVGADISDDETTVETQIGVVTLAGDGATYEQVARSDPGELPGPVTVATGLLTDGASAVERPLPAFAEARRSWTWWYVGGVLLVLGALAGGLARWRQRRSAR
ncbi:hypothetical protein I601_1545 [Nocardioides dokdonensis FR1436]|uniref:Uncharacterized protein n=1 Tax=Nocardioides dokdonensis FR1436 TaxID=1300347 RepID=A0A1A9GI68_9ACTN|nr:hypothetical protein [Nocardioides dokdonensis]ANH37978.1 hypothetical protein I601_1545 [Nocardioides dokdonensis FR1436]